MTRWEPAEPGSTEFKRLEAAMQMNGPVHEAMIAVPSRMVSVAVTSREHALRSSL